MSEINSLSDITNHGLCIGCGMCQSLVGKDKISISMSDKGRLEPEVIKPLTNLDFEKIKKTFSAVFRNQAVVTHYFFTRAVSRAVAHAHIAHSTRPSMSRKRKAGIKLEQRAKK